VHKMTGLLRYLKHIALGFLVMLPMVASYGFLFPWPAGEQAALGRYPGQVPIMVAEFYHPKSWRDRHSGDWMTSRSETRSYFLIPSVFVDPKIVTVAQINNDGPFVYESRVPFILLALAGMLALGAFGVRYFFMRPPKSYQLTAEQAKTFYGPRLPQN
jgi:hypothetical protein